MTDKIVSTTIEILGKLYPVRCQEEELASLQEAAKYLDNKMAEVQNSGKAINLERIAIVTALNVTSEYLAEKKEKILDEVNDRIVKLQQKIDRVIDDSTQVDLIYNVD